MHRFFRVTLRLLIVSASFAAATLAANAQESVARNSSAGFGLNDFVFMAGGVVIAALALSLIFRKIDVSVGQAVIAGAGVALFCLPFVTTFEWSDKGFKFTTRTETSELATQVTSLANEGIKTREDLTKVTEALRVANEKIALLQNSGGNTPSATPSPTVVPNWTKFSSPAFFDDLMKRNEDGLKTSTQNLGKIQTLQESLGRAQTQ
ncbi:hypothetical protein [Phyllobacterium sophorae]|uniref:Uncharacterized protein n=1 Tax=Phyllobacterium sophorae TaxID=1520277 RepID=A0A2P7B6K0_9HYPH|nr:hypothetical protein [Phyllobacterium sophorae]PSH62092.1 hypothetical protein CU103_19765 [Phyllobacterium sophorae]